MCAYHYGTLKGTHEQSLKSLDPSSEWIIHLLLCLHQRLIIPRGIMSMRTISYLLLHISKSSCVTLHNKAECPGRSLHAWHTCVSIHACSDKAPKYTHLCRESPGMDIMPQTCSLAQSEPVVSAALASLAFAHHAAWASVP